MTAALLRRALVPVLVLSAVACDSEFKGGGDLRAQKVVLKREVDGLREAVARLEKGQPILPLDDVAIAIDDTLVRDLIAAQLPFEMDVDRFHLSLTEAEAQFRGSPVVRLRGALRSKKRPDLAAAVNVIGALEGIQVEPSSSTLRARIAVDHIGIEKAAGIEQLLSGATLDEVARMVRLQLKDRLPPIQIPVKVQQSIDLPAVTHGPGADRRREDAAPGGGVPGARRAGAALDLRALPARRPREDGRRAGGGRRERRRGRGQPRRGRRRGRRPAGGQGQGEVTMRARNAALALLLVAPTLVAALACGREDRQTPDQLRAEIAGPREGAPVSPRARRTS